jgi:hypothetical protein
MAREGGCHEWYQTIGLDFVDISAKFLHSLKSNKRLNLGVSELGCAPFTNHGYPGMLQSAICIRISFLKTFSKL